MLLESRGLVVYDFGYRAYPSITRQKSYKNKLIATGVALIIADVSVSGEVRVKSAQLCRVHLMDVGSECVWGKPGNRAQ